MTISLSSSSYDCGIVGVVSSLYNVSMSHTRWQYKHLNVVWMPAIGSTITSFTSGWVLGPVVQPQYQMSSSDIILLIGPFFLNIFINNCGTRWQVLVNTVFFVTAEPSRVSWPTNYWEFSHRLMLHPLSFFQGWIMFCCKWWNIGHWLLLWSWLICYRCTVQLFYIIHC